MAMRVGFILLFCFVILALSIPSPAAQAITSSAKFTFSKEFTLDGSKVWTDTGIALVPGQRFVVTATGTLHYSDAKDR